MFFSNVKKDIWHQICKNMHLNKCCLAILKYIKITEDCKTSIVL
jgi:hypothetical protein